MRLPNRWIGQFLFSFSGAVAATLLVVMLVSEPAASAGIASPVATPGTVACDVEPRSEEELAQLAARAATPVASPEASGVLDASGQEGEAVDEQTLTEVEATLAQIAACSDSGDVARLLALYTDDYIVRDVLATEPVPIVPGTPSSVETTGTPGANESAIAVLGARMLPDGRVVAVIDRAGQVKSIILVKVDGGWRVDWVIDADNVVESTLPPPVRAAISHAADAASVPTSEVKIVAVEPTVWPDSSLGCPQPDQFYAQVETPGFIVTLDVAGAEVTYHTDEGEAVVPCETGEQ